ncbi:AAA family ATPase [Shewanella baltica]|jgi:cobaltochelatase CobS|uniref:AAA family ATPase n=1 Tax=Shewanella baltica TaxID=62322 RepID=UPI0002112F2D|nr:AAA family ATPase [Shewanella baltica]AEH16305.1 ATPase associated with various cellular activities AAA_5 [Shewanella baltica OS117]
MSIKVNHVSGSELFPSSAFLATKNLPVFAGMLNVPTVNPNYRVNERNLRIALGWLFGKSRNMSLACFGETGTGKTEFVAFIAAKLGLSLHRVSVSESMRPETLKGNIGIKNGETVFEESVVVKAYREGGILLLDEMDKGSYDLLASLHPILEGKPLAIEKTGEVVNPHPLFRVIATCQTPGIADMTGRYGSISTDMDEAVKRRFIWIGFAYPDVSVDTEILGDLTKLPFKIRLIMASFAKTVRDGMATDAMNAGEHHIQSALSTRVLVDWAVLWESLSDFTMREVFDVVFTAASTAEEKTALIELGKLHIGPMFDMNLADAASK